VQSFTGSRSLNPHAQLRFIDHQAQQGDSSIPFHLELLVPVIDAFGDFLLSGGLLILIVVTSHIAP
jgi:hypothetical protein